MTLSTPQVLFVAWQDSVSRKIVPVGRLLRLQGQFEFTYIAAVEEASALGFEPLLTFPELSAVYRSKELPPLFSNRLMPTSRADYAEHVGRLGLSPDEAEPFTVLARSAGKRVTDKLEVFAPPQVTGNKAEGLFLTRGMRHIPGAEDAAEQLSEQASLKVLADFQNDINPAALLLRSAGCHMLGYVPDYLAQELKRNDCSGSPMQVKVLRVNPRPAPVHHRLLCQFEFSHDSVPKLFTGPGFQPLASSASSVSPASAA